MTAAQPPGPWDASVLKYPAGTGVRVLLLTALVLISGVFVGDWLYLGTVAGRPGTVAPVQWLLVPPLAALATLAVLTLVDPAITERRCRLVEVPPGAGGTARSRLVRMAARAAPGPPPRLMWNPAAQGASARAYGTPWNHRIVVAPALLDAARRKPAAFDTVLRHELAHVRNRDLLPAAAARHAGNVVVLLLAVPVLWRLVDHDLSLLPDFLWRALLLVLFVHGVRAAVLRTREHYADVRAASWCDEPLRYARLFAAHRPVPPGLLRRLSRGLFSLHPAPGRRADVVTDPRLLGRPGSGELLALGLSATAALPLLQELIISLGQNPLTADRTSHTAAYAALGAGIAAIALRATGTETLGAGALLGSGAVLICGAVCGSMVSLAGTGLLPANGPSAGLASGAAAYVAAEAVTCAVAGGVLLVLLADGLRLRPAGDGRPPRVTRTVVLGVVGGGLAAASTFPAAVLVVEAGPASAREGLPLLTRNDPATIALGLLGVLCAFTVLAAARRRASLVIGLCVGAAWGAAATAGSIILRTAVQPFPNGDAVWAYYVDSVWIAIGAAALSVTLGGMRREGALLGVIASCTACLTATAGLAIVQAVVGRPMDQEALITTVQFIGNPAALITVPLAAAASVVGFTARRGTERASVARLGR
ncbi:M48 family metalloprotease [Kitasatospora sp. NPDC048722]|uniref:M48 family metalloprotease n=1 Tax=Kitasatospora sp. NPDC048722 TaxID=3155639 RepID=UPI0033F51995